MRFYAVGSLLPLVFSQSSFTSTCTDDGYLQINIPYNNEQTSNLISAKAGDCTGDNHLTGPGGADQNHVYSYDSDNSQAVLKIKIDACGLNENTYNEPTLRTSGPFFMAVADVSIGIKDGDQELVFYNAKLGAECGEKTDYVVKFEYDTDMKANGFNVADCHESSPDGQCIIAAFQDYQFTFKEYTNDQYNTEVDPATVVHVANNPIYLQLEAVGLEALNKKFGVKKCDFVDKLDDGTEVRYGMFDASQEKCENNFINLDFSMVADPWKARISHKLFLLSQGDKDSYSLECDVKVCDKNDVDSDCNAWTCEENDDKISYICDSACSDGYDCRPSDNNVAECTEKQCTCDNGNGATGTNCPVSGAAKCATCSDGFVLESEACVTNQPAGPPPQDTTPIPCAEQNSDAYLSALPTLYPGSCDFDPTSIQASTLTTYSQAPVESDLFKVWYFHSDSVLSWKDAREYCLNYGLQLAQIHSDAEKAESISLQEATGTASMKVFIGGHRTRDGTHGNGNNLGSGKEAYFWSNGQPICYDGTWGPGQPSNSGGDEYFMTQNKNFEYGWNDAPGTYNWANLYNIHFMCEYRCVV